MTYQAKELLHKLTYLTLAGKDSEGKLEFIGSEKEWELSSHDCHASPEDGCKACYAYGLSI